MKRLYRSRNDKQLSGVCAGIAQFLNCDPTIIRLVWVLVTVFSAAVPGLLLYLIFAVVIPEEPDPFDVTGSYHNND